MSDSVPAPPSDTVALREPATNHRSIANTSTQPSLDPENRYEQLHMLGEGAMGAVYLVRDRETGEQLALKKVVSDGGFFAQRIEDASMTGRFTEYTQIAAPPMASYVDARGRKHRVLMLTCQHDGRPLYVGLSVLSEAATASIEGSALAQLSAVAASLVRAGDSSGRRDDTSDVD